MTKEEFHRIVTEYGFPEDQVEYFWEHRPPDEFLTEENLREVCEQIKLKLSGIPRRTTRDQDRGKVH
jgi:hypothetical protein